ncbi:MAG TPA: 2-hydroxyacyl-CoA dehydratase family protein [Anaerolineae bacterium]|nr:2-hydroxyacyl-CoA dehydratase family protein [Anaerolineae bacterium]HOR01498.1 2-hydroxyacyl-CoA dehydratase family protein [Anaerolineae bacterium]HPL29186.1 2-hydroxyacyl-CoA dehydratase family protein [Anaerolineae bacterium]
MSAGIGVLGALQEAALRPLPALAAGSLAGVACSYTPLELLHAAGLVPLRLRAPGLPAPAAEAWLPSFACPLIRGVLGAALTGRLDALAAVILPHTCDSMQELAGIWRALRPAPPLLTFVEPLSLEGPRAPAYLRQELLSLAGRLEHLGRPVAAEALARSIVLYNRLRRAVQRIDSLRDRLAAAEAWAAIAAAWQMPPEHYLSLAEALIAELEARPPRPAQGPAVILAGSVLDEPLIPELIDALGGRVVGDDLCNGTRDAITLAAESGDPWAALADRLLARPACPAKHAPGAPYAARLANLAARRGAQGVIQVLVKFCDPHGFEAVPAGQALAASGTARLFLEVEAVNAPEQLRTRLQAFLEMLSAPADT